MVLLEYTFVLVVKTCTVECCSSIEKVFQPPDKHVLDTLGTNRRKFQSKWYHFVVNHKLLLSVKLLKRHSLKLD